MCLADTFKAAFWLLKSVGLLGSLYIKWFDRRKIERLSAQSTPVDL